MSMYIVDTLDRVLQRVSPDAEQLTDPRFVLVEAESNQEAIQKACCCAAIAKAGA